jgi:hypothetical protein
MFGRSNEIDIDTSAAQHQDSLAQLLDQLPVQRRIELNLTCLEPTLVNAKLHRGSNGAIDAVMLELCVDLRSPELTSEDTRRLREIADSVDAAVRKPMRR